MACQILSGLTQLGSGASETDGDLAESQDLSNVCLVLVVAAADVNVVTSFPDRMNSSSPCRTCT